MSKCEFWFAFQTIPLQIWMLGLWKLCISQALLVGQVLIWVTMTYFSRSQLSNYKLCFPENIFATMGRCWDCEILYLFSLLLSPRLSSGMDDLYLIFKITILSKYWCLFIVAPIWSTCAFFPVKVLPDQELIISPRISLCIPVAEGRPSVHEQASSCFLDQPGKKDTSLSSRNLIFINPLSSWVAAVSTALFCYPEHQ